MNMDKESYSLILKLNDNLCDLFLREITATREALFIVDKLLKEAVELLNETLIQMSSSLHDRKAAEGKPSKLSSVTPEAANNTLLEVLTKALLMTKELGDNVTKSTQSLQVEDIVTQILSSVTDRAQQIGSALTMIKKNLHQNGINEDVLNKLVLETEELMKRPLKRKIEQKSLREGDIELF